MKPYIKSLCILAVLAISANAQNLKITTSDIGKIKISKDGSTTLNFNFLVKTVKPILKQEDSVTVALLDKGLVIAPNIDNANGVLVVTNEKGDSYSIHFESVEKSDAISDVINFDDVAYSKEEPEEFDFESSNIEQDVTSIIKSLDNDVPLSGFEAHNSNYTISNEEFKMSRQVRHIGSKYVVERWRFQNTSKNSLYFENRDFASEGIIAISISPEEVAPGESATGYFVINKSSIIASELKD